LLVVALLIVLLFGRGKISDLMGDLAKGIKSFKSGLADDGERQAIEHREPQRIASQDTVQDSAPSTQQ